VLYDDDGAVVAGKTPSTPPDYSQGGMDVLGLLAEQIGGTVEAMLAKTKCHVA
jgi:N-methylhydantoinase A